MKELDKGGFINTSLLTATGKTIAENIKDAVNKNNNVLRNIENPYCLYTKDLQEYLTAKKRQ